MGSSAPRRRTRVERGIYRQANGRYAVCVMVDGRARFRTLSAATLGEARRQRQALQSVGGISELPLSPRLTFAEVADRWLAEFEAKVAAGRVLASLVGFLGDFDLAEEAAQDAFAAAAERWRRDGTLAARAA